MYLYIGRYVDKCNIVIGYIITSLSLENVPNRTQIWIAQSLARDRPPKYLLIIRFTLCSAIRGHFDRALIKAPLNLNC